MSVVGVLGATVLSQGRCGGGRARYLTDVLLVHAIIDVIAVEIDFTAGSMFRSLPAHPRERNWESRTRQKRRQRKQAGNPKHFPSS